MNRKLSIVTVSACHRIQQQAFTSTLASRPQAIIESGAFGLVVVCLAFVLFALAGYGIAELSMID